MENIVVGDGSVGGQDLLTQTAIHHCLENVSALFSMFLCHIES